MNAEKIAEVYRKAFETYCEGLVGALSSIGIENDAADAKMSLNATEQWIKLQQGQQANAWQKLVTMSRAMNEASGTDRQAIVKLIDQLDCKIYREIGDCPE